MAKAPDVSTRHSFVSSSARVILSALVRQRVAAICHRQLGPQTDIAGREALYVPHWVMASECILAGTVLSSQHSGAGQFGCDVLIGNCCTFMEYTTITQSLHPSGRRGALVVW
jgi:hypothetical protein